MASHIGKLPIAIPAGVEVKIEGQNFSAKGAKGSDSYVVPEGITAAVEGNEIVLTAADDLRQARSGSLHHGRHGQGCSRWLLQDS